MPIRSIIEQYRPGRGYPDIATIRKGAPRGEADNQRPQDLKHFRVKFNPQYQGYAETFAKLYGDQPTVFSDVYLYGWTVDEVFEFWLEHRDSTTVYRQCDGVHQMKWYDEVDHQYRFTARPCECDPDKRECRYSGQFRFILHDFSLQTGLLGYFVAFTHSKADVDTLYSALNQIQRDHGRLRQVPLVFGRAPRQTTSPKQVKKNGKYVIEGRVKTEKSLLFLTVHPDFARQHLLAASEAPMLPEPEKPSIDLSTEDAVRLLGNKGKGPRRLGGEPESIVGQQTEQHDQREPNWTDNEERWGKFLNWAEQAFQFDEDDVKLALQNAADYPIEQPSDWREDERTATAAVIALACEYDIAGIDKNTSTWGFQVKTRDIAIAIAERHLAEDNSEDIEFQEVS